MKVLVRKKAKFIVIWLLFTLLICNMEAKSMDITLPILNYIPSARAMGMGNAYTALCDDLSSIYFNPAGLASIYQNQIYGSYENPSVNSTYWLAGMGFPYRNEGSFGFAVNYLGNNNLFENIDEQNISDHDPSSQMLFLAGYGQHYKSKNKLRPYNLDMGLTLKFIRNSIFQYLSYGFGFDVGIKITPHPSTKLKNFNFGFTVQNAIKIKNSISENNSFHLIADLKKIDDTGWYFPKAKIGMAYFPHKRIALCLDVSKMFFTENSIDYNAGIAYKALKFMELRAGYNKGYAFGMGLDFYGVSFNSGFNNNSDIGFVGKFDMTIKFF